MVTPWIVVEPYQVYSCLQPLFSSISRSLWVFFKALLDDLLDAILGISTISILYFSVDHTHILSSDALWKSKEVLCWTACLISTWTDMFPTGWEKNLIWTDCTVERGNYQCSSCKLCVFIYWHRTFSEAAVVCADSQSCETWQRTSVPPGI